MQLPCHRACLVERIGGASPAGLASLIRLIRIAPTSLRPGLLLVHAWSRGLAMPVAPTVGLAAALALVGRFHLLSGFIIAGQFSYRHGNNRTALQCELHTLLGDVDSGDPPGTTGSQQNLPIGGHLRLGRGIIVVLIGQAT